MAKKTPLSEVQDALGIAPDAEEEPEPQRRQQPQEQQAPPEAQAPSTAAKKPLGRPPKAPSSQATDVPASSPRPAPRQGLPDPNELLAPIASRMQYVDVDYFVVVPKQGSTEVLAIGYGFDNFPRIYVKLSTRAIQQLQNLKQ